MTLSRNCHKPNERKTSGTNLNQGKVKVQTAHNLGVENVSKKRLNPCIRLCAIFEILKKMHDISFQSVKFQDLFIFTQVRRLFKMGVCANLTDKDYITSTHRGHGHCVAKGGDLKKMMAEIFGKSTGLGKGKGGSMHIADLDKGILGANGMVGGGFGLATGAAMRNKYLKTDDVAVCFFGDGAANEGNFHECLNMASIWNLPVVFVNENNLFAESTPQWYSSGSPTIAERAQAYNMPGVRVNGKDLFAVYQVAKEAIERARRGDGPTLIEAITYRNHGHFEGDEQKYKAPDGIEKEWADVDALEVFRDLVTEKGILSQDELDEIVAQSQKDVEDAIHFAQESPIPKEEALYEDVFAD